MGWRGDGDAAVEPKAPRLNAISNDKHRTGRPQQVREEHASATIQLLASAAATAHGRHWCSQESPSMSVGPRLRTGQW